MLISLLFAAAAASAITPAERTIIMDAVKAEVSGGSPSFGPIPPDAKIVCGRVNGRTFTANLIRNEKGRIVEARQVAVDSPDELAIVRQVVASTCYKAGYDI